mmetsp:Transcript_82232/g.220714  ORF Transcript_82232/g.220714 Transcript_82232/m.220714 type:complete len:101 (-) Transcript_82232:236-538(-)
MFDLVRQFQELTAATLTAACTRGSISTAEDEADAIVSGFAGQNFEKVNDSVYLTKSLESRTGYHDHGVIAKAIISNSLSNNQDVTGVVDKSIQKCPTSSA